MKKIIAIAGPIGAGKSEVATAILQYLNKDKEQAMLLPLAFPIKDLATQLGWNGVKDKKGRHLLQDLGTAARAYRSDTWINIWKQLAANSRCPEYLIVDDLRYKNEVDFFNQGKELKLSLLIYVSNPIAEKKRGKHASEQLLRTDMPKGSKVIFNTGSVEQLKTAVISLVDEYFELTTPVVEAETENKETEDVSANDGN